MRILSLCDILTIIFTVCKLTGHITWSWLWVLSPIWIGVLMAILLLIVGLCALAYLDVDTRHDFKRKPKKSWKNTLDEITRRLRNDPRS